MGPSSFQEGHKYLLARNSTWGKEGRKLWGVFLSSERSGKFYSIKIQRRPLKTFVSKRRDKYFRDVLLLSH